MRAESRAGEHVKQWAPSGNRRPNFDVDKRLLEISELSKRLTIYRHDAIQSTPDAVCREKLIVMILRAACGSKDEAISLPIIFACAVDKSQSASSCACIAIRHESRHGQRCWDVRHSFLVIATACPDQVARYRRGTYPPLFIGWISYALKCSAGRNH
jgi:hypothetical protein